MNAWRTVLVLLLVVLLVPSALAQEEEREPPACPTSLEGYAPQTGGVFMSWQLNAQTDVNVYRAEGDDAFVLIDRLEFPATRYIDHDAVRGETYRYQVTAIAERESEACDTFEITLVPFFPTWLAAMAGIALAITTYAVFMVRRG